VLCITSCSYPRQKPTLSHKNLYLYIYLWFNCVHQKYTTVAAESIMCFYTLGIFPRIMAYIQHLAISLTLLLDCRDSLFAEILPRQCPPSPSEHWYCCLWGVMDLVWLSSVHACFLNSITNLFAMSVSIQRPHTQKSHNREVYDLGWHYCPVQLHTEIIDHNKAKVNWHQWSKFI
jgi:hypothetical protein